MTLLVLCVTGAVLSLLAVGFFKWLQGRSLLGLPSDAAVKEYASRFEEEGHAYEEFTRAVHTHGHDSDEAREVMQKYELRIPGFRQKAIVAAGIAWMGNAGLSAAKPYVAKALEPVKTGVSGFRTMLSGLCIATAFAVKWLLRITGFSTACVLVLPTVYRRVWFWGEKEGYCKGEDPAIGFMLFGITLETLLSVFLVFALAPISPFTVAIALAATNFMSLCYEIGRCQKKKEE